MPSPVIIRLAILFLLFGAAACSKPGTPEQRIRALLDNAERAAEQKDIGTLRGDVSAHYTDADGRDRRTIDAILRLYLLRHESIHLLTRIESIGFVQRAEARVVLYVAMAARPLTDAAQLAAFHASLYRFDMDLAEESGVWRVTRADWRPAQAQDFIR